MSNYKTIILAIILSVLASVFVQVGLKNPIETPNNNTIQTQQKQQTKNQNNSFNQTESLQDTITSTIDKHGESIVSIIITKDLKVFYDDPYRFFGGYVTQETRKVGGGSGIIISSDGYVLTNNHVVGDRNANYSVMTQNGKEYKVDKIRKDPSLDLAVVKILDKNNNKPKSLKTANIIDKDSNIQIGQFVISIGNALSKFENTASFGIISGKDRQLDNLPNDKIYAGLYQTDAALNPGNSGGPLMDINGNVLGINTAISAIGQGIGFAIPVNRQIIDNTINSIQKNDTILRPFLGVGYQKITSQLAEKQNLKTKQGLYINEVVPGSPADKANIQKGDILTHFEGKSVNNKSFWYMLYSYDIGDTIQVTISSDGETRKIKTTLSENN